MADDVFGRAYVEIWPDLSKFKNMLRRKATTATRGVKFKVIVEPDIPKSRKLFKLKLEKIAQGIEFKLPVSPDLRGFTAKLRVRYREAISKFDASVPVVPDYTGFCKLLRSRLPNCHITYELPVDPNYAGFCEKLKRRMPRCPGVNYPLPVWPCLPPPRQPLPPIIPVEPERDRDTGIPSTSGESDNKSLQRDREREAAQRRLEKAIANATAAEDRYGRVAEKAAYDTEEAKLRVERATRRASEATNKYGEDSLEAREATQKLAKEERALADIGERVSTSHQAMALAAERVKESQDDLAKATAMAEVEQRHLAETQEKVSTHTERTKEKFSELHSTMALAIKTIGRATGVMFSLVSVLGPVSILLTKTGIATVKFTGAILPLAATLPSIAAGFGLVLGTLKLAGPAIGAAFKPITSLFSEGEKKGGVLSGVGELRTRIGELASKGIPELAQSFVDVNMPTIGRGMERIAIATNAVVRGVVAWANTARGQETIKMIVDATASAFERLAPKITTLVIAFGEMVRRLGAGAILGLGDVLGRAADAATRLINSITREDIARGMQTLRDAADAAFGKLQMLWGIIQFIANSEGKIKAVTDALAGIGIVLGAVTGYWPAVVAGAVTLILNHFNQIKTAGIALWQTLSNDPTVKLVFTRITAYASAFAKVFVQTFFYLSQYVVPIFKSAMNDLRATIESLRKSGIDWQTVFRAAGLVLAALAVFIIGTLAVIIKIITVSIRAWTTATTVLIQVYRALMTLFATAGGFRIVAAQIRVTISAVNLLAQVFRYLANVFLSTVGVIIHGAARAFGWIPGIGPKLKEAERQFNAFRDAVNRSLAGVRGRDVAVNVKSMINGQQVSITTRGEIVQIKSKKGTSIARAAGGPVYGPGGPTDDQVLATGPGGTKYRLSDGEYVLRASAVRKIGIPQLNAINRYAAGGPVGLNVRAGIPRISYESIATIVAKIAASMGKSVATILSNAVSTSSGFGGPAGPTSVSGNAALGRSMAAAIYGWVGSQWGALYKLWQGESGWNERAHNPSSGAHGIPQSLPASKMASAGADYYTNPATQIRWGLGYIKERYGSPLAALAAWQRRSPHWYDDGGVLPPGLTMAYNGTGRNEYVSKEPASTVTNNYFNFPNYVGDQSDLVRALNELRRQGRLQFT